MEYYKIAEALMSEEGEPSLYKTEGAITVAWRNCPAHIAAPTSNADWQALADSITTESVPEELLIVKYLFIALWPRNTWPQGRNLANHADRAVADQAQIFWDMIMAHPGSIDLNLEPVKMAIALCVEHTDLTQDEADRILARQPPINSKAMKTQQAR